MCSQEGRLDLEKEKHVVSYLGRAQLLPPLILEYLSTGNKLQLFSLRPIYLLPHFYINYSCFTLDLFFLQYHDTNIGMYKYPEIFMFC